MINARACVHVVAASPNSPQPRASAMLFPGFPVHGCPIGPLHWCAALLRILWLYMVLYRLVALVAVGNLTGSNSVMGEEGVRRFRSM